ncbi:hypothetical protein LXL04_006224 [Taraxacum kok-saghyz]
MTVKGGSRPACAACRFQRRRCSSDCPLAPFFPANQPKMFQNVHRLYGVGNVMKILTSIKNDEQKEEAMKSIKYEAYIRELYPVDGCYGRITSLKQDLVESMRELQYVRVLIHTCKQNKDPMNINEGKNDVDDHGLYHFGSSSHIDDHSKPYAWDDDRVKTSIDLDQDLMQFQRQFDNFQLSGGVDHVHGHGRLDFADNTCDQFVDDEQWLKGLKEEANDHDLSSFK